MVEIRQTFGEFTCKSTVVRYIKLTLTILVPVSIGKSFHAESGSGAIGKKYMEALEQCHRHNKSTSKLSHV